MFNVVKTLGLVDPVTMIKVISDLQISNLLFKGLL